MKPLFLLILFFWMTGTFFSCQKNISADSRTDFVKATGDPEAAGFYYSFSEDDNQLSYTLTNQNLSSVIIFGKEASSLLLRYTRVTDKKTNATTLYKSMLTPKDNNVSLIITDMTTGKVVQEKIFREMHQNRPDSLSGQYDSLEQCIANFTCHQRGSLQCDANRTCENQFGALTCCLNNGQCFSVHIIVPPTSWRCRFRDLVPVFDGLVLSQ